MGDHARKVLLICNTDWALFMFREPLMRALIQQGHQVWSITSDGRHIRRLKDMGVRPMTLDFGGRSLSVTANIRIIFRLWRMISKTRPDIVHGFTHKAAIFGSIAARLAGVRRVYVTITGLGTIFACSGARKGWLRWALLSQYRLALRCARRVFFQNPDDMDLFCRNGIVDTEKAVLTNGSGIDLELFAMPSADRVASLRKSLSAEIGTDLQERIVLLFPARALKEKGMLEYYAASKSVNESCDSYVFLHLGFTAEELGYGYPGGEIHRMARRCHVHFLGFKENIMDYMSASDVVVLPSAYGEGTPRSLIEALALGKFIITTDTPGCRDTVVNELNGFLVRPGDPDGLASRVLMVDRTRTEGARASSRELALAKYDVQDLIRSTLDHYFWDWNP